MKKFIFILTALFALYGTAQEQWELEKNSNGIKVYTKPVKGYDIKEFKAYTYIKASPEKLLSIINDADKFSQWIDKVEESKLIKKPASNVFIVYLTLGMPIGVSDRDMVLRNEVKKLKGGGYKINVTSAWKQYPEQDDYVRIKKAYGYWLIKPEKGTTKIEYRFFSDPAGSLPTWIVNMFLVDGPYKTLTNLKKMFE
jgi:ribosome-associated toxin RatA of RatAB toxin-antitoxin module